MQTPLRDSYFLEKLSGFGSDDGVVLNPILVSIFFLDRVLPPIYGALLSPSAKNGNWLPSWPFLYSAMLFGSFSLLPYFAMWEPSAESPKVSMNPCATRHDLIESISSLLCVHLLHSRTCMP